MGEIRSTIDIMMERTKGMSLSPEEKRALELEELQRKAKGLHFRLIQSPDQMDSILVGIDREGKEDVRCLGSLLWNTFVENLPSGEDLFSYLDLMKKLPATSDRIALVLDLQKELRASAKSHTKDRKAALLSERKKLAAAGISGTAVVPKLKEDKGDREYILEKYKKLLIYEIN